MTDTAAPILSLTEVSKIYCDDLLISSRYALQDLLRPWRLRKAETLRHLRPHEFTALDHISINLKEGEIVGVLGSRRSGKSTLAGIVSGLIRHDGGKVRRPKNTLLVNSMTAGMRPTLTLEENAIFRAALYGLDSQQAKKLAQQAIEMIGAQGEAKRLAYNIDPRVMRNVGMAIALQLRPDFFVFDNALNLGAMPDENTALNLLNSALEKRSALIISSNIRQVEHHCERCYVLDQGRIVFHGPTAEAIKFYQNIEFSDSYFGLDEEGDEDTDEIGDNADDREIENEILAADITDEERELRRQIKADFHTHRQQRRDIRARKRTAVRAAKIIINGHDYLAHKKPLLARPGEDLDLDIIIDLGPDLELDIVQLSLNQSYVVKSFMQYRPPYEIIRTQNRRQLHVKGTLKFPQLYHNQYGLTLFVPSGTDEPNRDNNVKLAIIDTYDAPIGGNGLSLDFVSSSEITPANKADA